MRPWLAASYLYLGPEANRRVPAQHPKRRIAAPTSPARTLPPVTTVPWPARGADYFRRYRRVPCTQEVVLAAPEGEPATGGATIAATGLAGRDGTLNPDVIPDEAMNPARNVGTCK